MPERVFKEPYKKLIVIVVALAIIISTTSAVLILTGIKYFTEPAEAEEAPPLFVKIFVDETSGIVPYEVDFTSLVLYYVGSITYNWDFGDNETSNEINPSHNYSENGTFICTLTVTDSTGEEAMDSIEITATTNEPPDAKIVVNSWYRRSTNLIYRKLKSKHIYYILENPPSFIENQKGLVTCEAQVTDPEGDEIISYKWTLLRPQVDLMLGFTKEIPDHIFYGKTVNIPLLYTFQDSKDYIIELEVEDAAGNIVIVKEKFEIRKSELEDFIDGVGRSIESFRLWVWNMFLADTLGPEVEKYLLDGFLWPLLEKIPLPILGFFIKFKFLKKAFDWKIYNFFEFIDAALQNVKPVLDKNPELAETTKEFLIWLQQYLEEHEQMGKVISSFFDPEEWLERWELVNNKPKLSDPSPKHGSEVVSTDFPHVVISVTDLEGDPFDIKIYGNDVNDVYKTNQHNGTFNATLITPLPNLTDISWHVSVYDSEGRWVNETYKFTTW